VLPPVSECLNLMVSCRVTSLRLNLMVDYHFELLGGLLFGGGLPELGLSLVVLAGLLELLG
jgi:hypothetical protein